jgi:N-methylhydantoinase A
MSEVPERLVTTQQSRSDWIVGVDVGGTFTDFFAFDRNSGTVQVHKTPSTPDNPAKAIILGLRELGERHSVPLDAVAHLAHGTTVATNALIQRKGGTVAVVTTRGFRDLLEIGRQVRPRMYDMRLDYPEPLAKREHRFEITERVGPDGSVLSPLKEDELDGIVQSLRDSGAQACAICLLFAHLNPAHERKIAAYLRSSLPNLTVSLGSEVHPEFREFERFSTTLLNAYLQPVLDSYMHLLQREITELLPAARIGINQSSGGLMSIDRARAFPIRTALSGPAAGAVGASHMARLSGRSAVITLDMGGTSADVALIRDFEAGIAFGRDVEGFPVRLPMVDINTVGAGGGSIARFGSDGLLKVGPLSAGATPGPACYGRGGEEATVTDANVVLGRLSERGLLGGAMRLNPDAARKVIEPIARHLGFSLERTAQGILDIVTANMVRAIRAISVERGYDPRTFTLLAFGGAGPLVATSVARALDIREVLIPLRPGILCAQGLVVAELKEHFVLSRRLPVNAGAMRTLSELVKSLKSEALEWFSREDVAEQARRFNVQLDMRYVGQNFELQVPFELDDLIGGSADDDSIRQKFFHAHELSYGFFTPADPIEIINIRMTARASVPLPPAARASHGSSANPDPVSRRPVWFGDEKYGDTPVYRRDDLGPGFAIVGPAVIDQFDATTVVYPGDRVRVDQALNLLIELAP